MVIYRYSAPVSESEAWLITLDYSLLDQTRLAIAMKGMMKTKKDIALQNSQCMLNYHIILLNIARKKQTTDEHGMP